MGPSIGRYIRPLTYFLVFEQVEQTIMLQSKYNQMSEVIRVGDTERDITKVPECK